MLGLLGGMSWESSREYYRLLNEHIREVKGGLHSAPLIMHSFDFADIAALQKSEDWTPLNSIMAEAAQGLEKAGAAAIMICTNYMHKSAPAIEQACNIPLIHIADAVGGAIARDGFSCVGLLGARGTMCEPFYKQRLATHGIDVIIPQEEQIDFVHRSIFEEMCQGIFSEATAQRYGEIMEQLKQRGAQGIILGCTEIEQLVSAESTSLALYPSAALHARAGADWLIHQRRVMAA